MADSSDVRLRQYLERKINPILEEIIAELLKDMPEDPVPLMIRKLTECHNHEGGGVSSLDSISCCNVSGSNNKGSIGGSGDAGSREASAGGLPECCVDSELAYSLEKQRLDVETSSARDAPSEEEDEDEEDDDEIAELPDVLQRRTVGGFNNKFRPSVSAEAHGQWNVKKDSQLISIPKTGMQKQRIRAVLEQSFLFQNLEPKELDRVIDCMEEKAVQVGETVINQGDDGDVLYVVEEGELECFQDIVPSSDSSSDGSSSFATGEETVAAEGSNGESSAGSAPGRRLVKTCRAADAFGELALLYNCPRAASVISKVECVLWQLDRQSFNQIVKASATRKREMYDKFLQGVPILQSMNAWERAKIADGLKKEVFADGTYIVRQGTQGDRFYIIEEGNALATKAFVPGQKPREVMAYKQGDYFGELALLKNEPRAANVIAKGPVTTVALDRRSFNRLLGPLKEILAREAEQRYED